MKNTTMIKNTEAAEAAQAQERWLDVIDTFDRAEIDLLRADEAVAALKDSIAGLETERESLLSSRSSIESLAGRLGELCSKRVILERRLQAAVAEASLVREQFKIFARDAIGEVNPRLDTLLAAYSNAMSALRSATASPRVHPIYESLIRAKSATMSAKYDITGPLLVRAFQRGEAELVAKTGEILQLASELAERWAAIAGKGGDQ